MLPSLGSICVYVCFPNLGIICKYTCYQDIENICIYIFIERALIGACLHISLGNMCFWHRRCQRQEGPREVVVLIVVVVCVLSVCTDLLRGIKFASKHKYSTRTFHLKDWLYLYTDLLRGPWSLSTRKCKLYWLSQRGLFPLNKAIYLHAYF